MTLAEAETLLRPIPEYGWLLNSGQQWYKLEELQTITGIGPAAWTKRCEDGRVPGAVNHGYGVGWRAPRSGLLIYFGRLVAENRQHDAG